MLKWFIAGRIVGLLDSLIPRLHHGDTTFSGPAGPLGRWLVVVRPC
jgi:hypothetical protein